MKFGRMQVDQAEGSILGTFFAGDGSEMEEGQSAFKA